MLNSYIIIGLFVAIVVALSFWGKSKENNHNGFAKNRNLSDIIERARKLSLKSNQKRKALGMFETVLLLHNDEDIQQKCGCSVKNYISRMRN